MYDKYNKKILDYKDSNLYIIFYSPNCKYCLDTINLLKHKKLSFKGYNIDNFRGGMVSLLYHLKHQHKLTGFDVNHSTKPVIFHKGKFVGGFTELKKLLN